MNQNATGVRRVLNAARYSWKGLCAAWRHEEAFRQEIGLLVVACVAAPLVARSLLEAVLLVGVVLLIIMAELLNSAVEALTDRVSTERHQLSGQAKDMGSAAVMVAMILAGLVWGAVIWQNFLA